jgi:hypothetical protein
MDNVQLKPGDIFMNDSDKTGQKIVKFFMTAPNVFVHIWRKVRGTQEKVRFYHPGIVSDDTSKVLEQQKYVQYSNAQKVIFDRSHIVYRNKTLKNKDIEKLLKIAKDDLGQGWGVAHTLGRFGTWLTGNPLFARFVSLPNREVSAGRVARWYYESFGETFGEKHYRYVTTHTIDKWCLTHPETWEIVSYKE